MWNWNYWTVKDEPWDQLDREDLAHGGGGGGWGGNPRRAACCFEDSNLLNKGLF